MPAQKEMTPVPFHGETVYLVEHDAQPYAPVKPICENIGVAWQSQLQKLKNNAKRWGITMIVIPSAGGPQEMLCLPIRKLPAYLLSIDPRKVKDEVRFKLEIYQEECDEALWAYWSEGLAVNPRADEPDGAWVPVAELVTITRQLTEYNDLLKAKIPKPRKKSESVGKKLNNEMVVKIYDLLREGKSGRIIAEELGISQAAVSYVRNLRPQLPLPEVG